MSGHVDPIFLAPRMLPRRWGRADLNTWCKGASKPSAPVGEIWAAHPANVTDAGCHFGVCLSAAPNDMLGELGRAPPSVRFMLSSETTDPVITDERLALWRILEAPIDAAITVSSPSLPDRRTRCRRGDLFRIDGGAHLMFDGDVAALEVRPNFVPSNRTPTRRPLRRLLAARERQARPTWLRDPSLSVEAWKLPEQSFIEPDGETCHVLTALTPGAALDGRAIARGQSVFIPANGRRSVLTGRGAEVMVSYPDLVPTDIWRPGPEPDPATAARLPHPGAYQWDPSHAYHPPLAA